MNIRKVLDKFEIYHISAAQIHCQFLQSWEWKEFQERVGRKTLMLGVEESGRIIGYALFIYHKLGFFSYWYCPRGPLFLPEISKDQQETAVSLLLQYLKEKAKAERTLFMRIEPPLTLEKKQWIEDIWWQSRFPWKRTSFVQPSDTLLLNLNQTPTALLAAMRPKTRYNIKLAKRKGVNVREGNTKEESDVFCRLLQQTAQRQSIRTHLPDYYRALLKIKGADMECRCFTAYYEDVPVASILVLYYLSYAIYLHGGTSGEYRNVMAPHLLQWQSILHAIERGCRYYDFYGVAPATADEHHPLANVGRFKRGFGGREVNYVGTYDIVFDKIWYLVYGIGRRLGRLWRKRGA